MPRSSSASHPSAASGTRPTPTRTELARILEPGDELGLPWGRWADGRVWQLRRGREWLGSTSELHEAAENAAARLGRAVRVHRDNRADGDVVWVQFADHHLLLGDPCACGSTDLRWASDLVAICSDCRAVSFVTLPKPPKGSPEQANTGEADELLSLLLGTGTAKGRAARPAKTAPVGASPEVRNGAAKPRKERSAVLQLGHFTDVRLREWEGGDPEAARSKRVFYGHGRDSAGRLALLTVIFPLRDGHLRTDRDDDVVHRVAAIDAAYFEPILNVDALRRAPFAIDAAALLPATQLRPAPPQAVARVPRPLTAWSSVRLIPKDRTATVSRYCGIGVNAKGMQVMLHVEVDLEHGQRVADPDSPAGFRHRALAMRAEPFREALQPAWLARALPVEQLGLGGSVRIGSGDGVTKETS
jgi:hypothetical protein